MYHFTHIQIAQKLMSSNIRLILSTDIIFVTFITFQEESSTKIASFKQQI